MSEVIELLRAMVATPSVSCGSCGEPDATHGESRMVELVAEFWDRHHVDYQIQEVHPGRDNVIARVEGGSGPSLLLEAHTDTVEVENMVIEPFDPVVKAGRVYGRGSCDDKASLAAMMIGVRNAAEQGLAGTVTMAAAADEEYGFHGARKLVESGFMAEGAVVGEPTGLQLVIAHKGACRLNISTYGTAVHSSRPHEGDNAIYAMAEIVRGLRDYADALYQRPQHPLVGGPTCCVGMISGGQAPNIVPDRCEVSVDRRVIPGEDMPVVEEEIRNTIAAAVGDEITWDLELSLAGLPLETDPECGIVLRACQAIGAVTGDTKLVGAQYGTDAAAFSRSGIPSVVVGPGSIEQAHTAVEYVDIDQVERAALIYEELCLA